jgi:hypothetical protein
MKSKTLFLCAVVLACAALMLASCSSVGVYHRSSRKIGRGHGPPPHAPAHGYRHNHRTKGVDLVYDSGCGAYVVVGLPGHYYCDGHFFRFRGAHWEVSLNTTHGWEPAYEDSIPPGLRTKGKSKGKWKKASYSRTHKNKPL